MEFSNRKLVRSTGGSRARIDHTSPAEPSDLGKRINAAAKPTIVKARELSGRIRSIGESYCEPLFGTTHSSTRLTRKAMAGAIAKLEGIEDHRPCIGVRAGGVTVRLLTVAGDW